MKTKTLNETEGGTRMKGKVLSKTIFRKLMSLVLVVAMVAAMLPLKSAEAADEEQIPDYLCFTAVNETASLSFGKECGDIETSANEDVKLEYSFTGAANDWTPYVNHTKIVLNSAHPRVYFKGDNGTITGIDGNYSFFITDEVEASGNVMSIVSSDCSQTSIEGYGFSGLFYGCTGLKTAPELPATSLGEYCYQNMFYGCTGLVSAPALPATALAEGVYCYMFGGCTSLKVAPALPAKLLQPGCYSDMFRECTSLEVPPAFQCEGFADVGNYYGEYGATFAGCTSLTMTDSEDDAGGFTTPWGASVCFEIDEYLSYTDDQTLTFEGTAVPNPDIDDGCFIWYAKGATYVLNNGTTKADKSDNYGYITPEHGYFACNMDNVVTAHPNEGYAMDIVCLEGNSVTIRPNTENPDKYTDRIYTVGPGNKTITAVFHPWIFDTGEDSTGDSYLMAYCSIPTCPSGIVSEETAVKLHLDIDSSVTYTGNPVTASYTEGEEAAWNIATMNKAPAITYQQKVNDTWTDISSAPTAVGEYRAVAKLTINEQDYSIYKDFNIVKQKINSVAFSSEPSVSAGESAVTSGLVDDSSNYTAASSWTPETDENGKYKYNTSYTATVTFTPKANYEFADGATVPTGWSKASGSTSESLVITKSYSATAKAKITSVTAPSVTEQLTAFTTLSDQLTALKTNSPTAAVTVEDSSVSSMAVEWSLQTGASYSTNAEAVNTFVWEIPVAQYANYNLNGKTVKGSVDIKNPKHVHNLIYSAQGAVLSAYCSNNGTQGCVLDEASKQTLTLVAESSVYSGTEKTAAYKSGEATAWKNLTGNEAPTITYEKKNGENWTVMTSNPIAVGTYRAKAKINDDVIAYIDFSITPANISSVTFTDLTAPSAGAVAPSELSVPDTADYTGTVSWTPALTAGKFKYYTEYSATVTLSPNTNYRFTDAVTYPEGWTKQSSTTSEIVLSKAYATTDKAKIISVTTPDVIYQLASFTTKEGQLATLNSSFPTVAVTVEDSSVSSMAIEWMLKEGTAYSSESEAVNVFSWKIKPSEYSDYNQNGITLYGDVSTQNPVHNHEWQYTSDGTVIYAKCAKGGTEGCPYDENHKVSFSLTAGTPVFSGNAVVYDPLGTNGAIKPSNTGNWTGAGLAVPQEAVYYLDNSSMTKTTNANSGAAGEGKAPKNAGRYIAEVTVGEGTAAVKARVKFQISPAELTISQAEIGKKTYDGTISATVTKLVFGGLIEGDELVADSDYSVKAEFDKPNAEGPNKATKATVTVTLSSELKNYIIPVNTYVIDQATIEQATPTIDHSKKVPAYIGQKLEDVSLQDIKATVTRNGSNLTVDGAFEWSAPDTVLGSIGDKTFEVKFVPADTNNYCNVSNIMIDLEVSKNPQIISAEDISLVLGSSGKKIDAKALGEVKISYKVVNGEDIVEVDPETGEIKVLRTGQAKIEISTEETDLYKAGKRQIVITVKDSEELPVAVIVTEKNKNQDTEDKDADGKAAEDKDADGKTTEDKNADSKAADGKATSEEDDAGRKTTSIKRSDDVEKTGSVEIPETLEVNGEEKIVTEIAADAFKKETQLEQVAMPDTIEKIGRRAFKYCSELTNVEISNNVTQMNRSAFYGCKSLEKVELNDKLRYIGGFAFKKCTELKEITFGSGLKELGRSVFCGCKSLESVVIPKSVESMGKNLFYGCKSLESITIETTKLNKKNLAMNVFRNVPESLIIYVPTSKKKAYEKLFREKGLNEKVQIKAIGE